MAKIIPFKGIHYNTKLVDPNDVTSPPYDVISPADNVYFHEKHPKNVVRLILGMELPDDNPTDNRFTRAAAYLHEWIAEGTLVQDPKPVFYAYEQKYSLRGQNKVVRAFISLVKIHNYDEDVILPHEYTLARPKSNLAQLIRATNSNLDSVYGLYPDEEHKINAVLDRIAAEPPMEEAVDRYGVRHRLWMVSKQEDIDLITRTMSDKQIVIADGHHRYETSLGYRDEMRAKEGNPEEERPYDYVMMTLVNAYSPDLEILPTHRMVRNLSEEALESLKKQLPDCFELIPVDKKNISATMAQYSGKSIGICLSDSAWVAIPKPGTSEYTELDVLVLHDIIFERILGIDQERLRAEANVVYTRDETEAINAVDTGEFQAAFLLNPIKLDVMLAVSQAGRRMPQKATYFYPKLLSGFIMRKIEQE